MLLQHIRENILAAREKRAFLREQYARQGKASLSLALNIPDYPKSTPLFAAFFDHILMELKRFLLAHRVLLDTEQEVCVCDEAGEFYLVPLRKPRSLADIKEICETFEEQHPIGRLLDVDVVDRDRQPVSSHKLKRCFLCEQPAIICMREQTHSYQELREEITVRIAAYLDRKQQERICKQLAVFALKAVLYEVSVSPKPGLVDQLNSGAHQDMDYFTFLDSSAALSGYFQDVAQAGYIFDADDMPQALPRIREIGLQMESAMFQATGGVNTQKGLIFLLGLSLFATSYLLAHEGSFTVEKCREVIRNICRNLVQKELHTPQENDPTHGISCFRQYGAEYGGVRQEAQEGLPSVFEHGLGELNAQLSGHDDRLNGRVLNDALLQTLLRLMTVVNDTNILYRKDLDTLNTIKQMAQHVLNANTPEENTVRYTQLIDYCQQEQVSPGGSADLLAVTIFFFSCSNMRLKAQGR